MPKGTDFRKVTAAYILRVETWINNYPRDVYKRQTYYFTAVVIECGALMLKRLSEIIVARVKKKEKIEPETDTDESEVL